MNSKINLKDVEYSINDIKRKIFVPNYLSLNLSEIIGTLLGDGHLGIHKAKKEDTKRHRYDLNISGHITEDYPYYMKFNQKFYETFNVMLNIKKYQKKNALSITIGSKSILTFFRSINFPIGNKNNCALIPAIIKNASKLEKSACLRGLADTDFSLTFKHRKKTRHSYPVIRGTFKSKKLFKICVNYFPIWVFITDQIQITAMRKDGMFGTNSIPYT